MDAQAHVCRFDQAVSNLPERLRNILLTLPASVKNSVFEVRLRAGNPLMLTCPNQNWFVDAKSQLHGLPSACFAVTPQELEQAILTMCSYSIHTHQNEIKNGFISLRGGHRAGVCGTAVLLEGKIGAVRDITSVNLRIARDIIGASDEVVRRAFSGSICGALIAGPPSSGKTTILRDLARQLAGGRTGRFLKVAVVDERCELGAVYEGVPQNDLGPGCDILSGYPKGEGILQAVRALSPQVIICDEIGGEEEAAGMMNGLRCGVCIIASAHAGTPEELLGRRVIIHLLSEGVFQNIIMLGSADQPGRVEGIIRAEDLRYENNRYVINRSVMFHDGNVNGVKFIRSCEKT